MFKKKNIFDDEKNLIYIIDFLCQIKILLLNMLKIPGFLFKIPSLLCLNC